LVALNWLVIINVALWSYLLPMLGVLNLVRFKKGGPYGSEGTYISNKTALISVVGMALVSHFVLSPMVKILVESLCSSDPIWGCILILSALLLMWNYILKSRTRES